MGHLHDANDNMKNETIILLDGRELLCYPTENGKTKIDNNLKVDTTGQYLRIGHRKPIVQPKSPDKETATQLFTDHAFFFLKHQEKILNDSRMFLAPVNVDNHLAYFGTNGFQHPTLGIYIQWWMTCEASIMKGKTIDDCWLVYLIAGSPLSGRNSCGIVNPQGECKNINLPGSFNSVWSTFVDINTRYDEAKELYDAYSLEKVVELLKADEGSF